MAKLNFFPLGNADCCRIDLDGGQKVLFDCAHTFCSDDEDDLRCDLHKELRDDLKANNRDYFDVVAFTHLDRDHYCKCTDFFWLQHSKKHQGEGRIMINVMWVPAAVITEEVPDGDDYEEARLLQKEARHRFKKGAGVRVFSRPERLRAWCESNDVSLDDRRTVVTDAGELVSEFTLDAHGVEFFVHSPFAVRQDACTVEDRNSDGIIMHATFNAGGATTKVLLMADATHETLTDIVTITKHYGNADRLEWDVAKLPHHCSYLSLGPEKGEAKTKPVPEVAWLYEEGGQDGAMIVSTSKPIPVKGSEEDKDLQPPHREAANYYRDLLSEKNGEFIVTMEHPKASAPKPVVIEIGSSGATLKLAAMTAAQYATSRPAPRAG
jgi:hypothetical protein